MEPAGIQYDEGGGESSLEGMKRRQQSRMGHLLVGGEDDDGEADMSSGLVLEHMPESRLDP